jgi:hypothetical protein
MGAAVQHHHLSAGFLPVPQLRRIDADGAVMVLHPFAECLGRDVHAAEQDMARCRPGRRATIQHRDIGGADAFEPPRQRLRQAAPVVDASDARGQARQQRAGAAFAFGQRAWHRPEQMGGTEFAFLPRIEHGEFGFIFQPVTERGGIDAPQAHSPRRGWGTWIRTKAARVRAGSSTAKLSPTGAPQGAGRRNSTHPRQRQHGR